MLDMTPRVASGYRNWSGMKHTEPTAYWVIRHYDDVRFNLVTDRDTAERYVESCEQEFDEPFRVASEHRDTIPYHELPEAWEDDWLERIPDSITVTDIPDYATPK